MTGILARKIAKLRRVNKHTGDHPRSSRDGVGVVVLEGRVRCVDE